MDFRIGHISGCMQYGLPHWPSTSKCYLKQMIPSTSTLIISTWNGFLLSLTCRQTHTLKLPCVRLRILFNFLCLFFSPQARTIGALHSLVYHFWWHISMNFFQWRPLKKEVRAISISELRKEESLNSRVFIYYLKLATSFWTDCLTNQGNIALRMVPNNIFTIIFYVKWYH